MWMEEGSCGIGGIFYVLINGLQLFRGRYGLCAPLGRCPCWGGVSPENPLNAVEGFSGRFSEAQGFWWVCGCVGWLVFAVEYTLLPPVVSFSSLSDSLPYRLHRASS